MASDKSVNLAEQAYNVRIDPVLGPKYLARWNSYVAIVMIHGA